jgi:hypothetical protein
MVLDTVRPVEKVESMFLVGAARGGNILMDIATEMNLYDDIHVVVI